MRHVPVTFLTVGDVAEILGVPRKTVTRWCESGRLPAIPQAYGQKTTYGITPQAVELFSATLVEEKASERELTKPTKVSNLPHREQITPWLESLRCGVMTGKAFSPRTIGDYRFYAEKFFQRHAELSIQTLKAELSSVSPENFAKRDKVFKAMVCFGKYLIQETCLPPAFLDEAKQLRPRRHLPVKRLSVDDIGLDKLLKACSTPLETLVITLLSNTGIRASEACQIRLEDIDQEKGILTIQCGKGGKTRKVGLSQAVIEALKSHLGANEHRKTGWLFMNQNNNPLDRHNIYRCVQRVADNAGVTAYPHALRRAFVTQNANKGRPLQMLQLACGHSNIKTTMGYCMTSEQDVVDAMKSWE